MESAAILAGGRASRMGGQDKGRLLVGARTILERELDALAGLGCPVVIITPEPDRYADTGLAVIADALPGCGSLGGIYTAVTLGDGPVLVLACDMPFLTTAFLARLQEAGREADVAIPKTPAGYHPLCASYAPSCAPAIRSRIEAGALKATGFLQDVRVREVGPGEIAPFDPDGLLLFNVNTPADLAAARAAARRLARAARRGPS
ncbi:MAG TPA: molybdenum cofactor guanylyltransferase [Vicinamibacterales bacterium]|nr:molybdenum cofactor guanylyltransferase [Vicinamibacterales bacterium]HPW21934.1 molybdenum cofactor guanylyltransferase [Vicinamibacterales bacterium]